MKAKSALVEGFRRGLGMKYRLENVFLDECANNFGRGRGHHVCNSFIIVLRSGGSGANDFDFEGWGGKNWRRQDGCELMIQRLHWANKGCVMGD